VNRLAGFAMLLAVIRWKPYSTAWAFTLAPTQIPTAASSMAVFVILACVFILLVSDFLQSFVWLFAFDTFQRTLTSLLRSHVRSASISIKPHGSVVVDEFLVQFSAIYSQFWDIPRAAFRTDFPWSSPLQAIVRLRVPKDVKRRCRAQTRLHTLYSPRRRGGGRAKRSLNLPTVLGEQKRTDETEKRRVSSLC
jgi:hypothetical protein